MARRALRLAAASLAGVAAYRPGSPFVEGEVCEGVDLSSPASSILRGKHLLMGGLDWAPLAYPDPSRPRGWGGVDIELMDRLSEMLGFNYSIRDIGYPAEGATWLDHFASEVHNADALLSYWTESTERIESGLFVKGHVDLSLALLSRTSGEDSDSWATSFYSWSLPFDKYLWFSISFIIIASAAVDYLVERHDTASTFRESLYEYSAGVLWGGYGEPKSSCSAIYQVMISFFMLILISSYTANLAAFITLSATPSSTIQWMDQAVLEKRAVCVDMGSPWAGKLKVTFPRAKWIDTSPYVAGGLPRYLDDDCDGMVVPKTEWRTMQMDSEWCHLHAVEVVSAAETAGWATNFKSGCVAKAFSWAMTSLIESGQVEMVMSDYFPAAACSSSGAPAGSRRLAEAPPQGEASSWTGLSWTSVAGSLAARLPRASGGGRSATARQAAARGRRMKSRVPEVQAGSDDDTQQMTVSSFVGLFAVWGLLSVGSVAWTYLVPDSWKKLPRAPKACGRWLGQQGESLPAKTPGDGGSETDSARERRDSLPGHLRMTDIWSNTEQTLSILRRLEQICAMSSARGGGGIADCHGNNKVSFRVQPDPRAGSDKATKVEWDAELADMSSAVPSSSLTPDPSVSCLSTRKGSDWLDAALCQLESRTGRQRF